MWLRLRLDIGWRDLVRGGLSSIWPGTATAAQGELESFWSEGRNDALACLCVRSALDLLLQALELPSDSEVLFSAVTIQDMPQIAAAHGLLPVPVDVRGSNYQIDVESLRSAVTKTSKVLVVAHLFGARPDMQEVLDVAREHNLYVIEDCAQAWFERRWRGHEQADASLFSFGAIKTATALAGALCRVQDPGILARMRDIQSQQPIQAAGRLPFKFCKFALLKMISTRIAFGAIAAGGKRFGISVDNILGGLTRGFSGDDWFRQLRQRPSAGTLRLLEHRLKTYDSQRVARRICNAQRMISRLRLQESQPELVDSQHSYWLFPFVTDRANELIEHLRQHGFDTTQRGRLQVVPAPAGRRDLDCPMATQLLNQTVFLPCYPEMTDRAINNLCDLILSFKPSRPDNSRVIAIGQGPI